MRRNLFAEQMHYVGTVDNLARERASRGKHWAFCVHVTQKPGMKRSG